MSGGQAIEHLARRGDPRAFEFPVPMWKYKDCTFSFAGLKNSLLRLTQQLEEKHGKCTKVFLGYISYVNIKCSKCEPTVVTCT